jgi:hypothetical protein
MILQADPRRALCVQCHLSEGPTLAPPGAHRGAHGQGDRP